MATTANTARLQPSDPSITLLHRDWQDDWAPGLRSSRLRKAISENPRLQHRPAAMLSRLLDLPDFNPDDLSFEDAHAFAVLNSDPEGFTRLVGLAALAPAFASIVDSAEVRVLMTEFPGDLLRLALECRDVADPAMATSVERQRFATVAAATGPRMIRDWAETLPASARGRVRLLFPKTVLPPQGSERSVNHIGVRVIRKAAMLVSPPERNESSAHGWT